MQGLLRDGFVVAAGSFGPDDDGGLFLYEVAALSDARKLIDDNPYIQTGSATVRFFKEYVIHGANTALLQVKS